MRRFSTAAAAAILLFTATGFAGYDEWNCNETSMLKLTGLQCVSCGVQKYYADTGKGEVVPSEKWLAMLGAGARNFRELNPGEKGSKAESVVRNDIAKKNMQKVVISQIQAYNFCTKKSRVDWGFVKGFITNDRERSKDDVADLAKSWGFKKGVFSSTPAYDNYRRLVDDSAMNRSPLEDKRRAFRENSKDIIASGDAGDDLRDCMSEMESRDRLNDPQSYQLCTTMANACDVEGDFCRTAGMQLPAQPGTPRNPSPAPPSSGGTNQRLPPPPPGSGPSVQ